MKIVKSVQAGCLALLMGFVFGSVASANFLSVDDAGAVGSQPLLLADKGKSGETVKGEGMGKGKGTEMGKGEGMDKAKGEGSGGDNGHGKDEKEGNGDSHGKKGH